MNSAAPRPTATVDHEAHPNIMRRTELAGLTANGECSFRHVRASEERNRSLIHHLPVALLQVDARCVAELFPKLKADGVVDLGGYLDEHPEMMDFAIQSIRVTEVNHQAMSLFGATTPASLVGPIGLVLAESPETLRRVMIARFDGKRNYAEIARIRTFDGRLRDVRLSVTFPINPEQIDVSLLCLEDVTDRLRAGRQLRRLLAEFAHSARVSMLGELTTSIAHEVNQPLGAIVTNAETSLRLLSRGDPNVAKITQLTSRIAASARRASDIVKRIRGMAAKHETEQMPLDLNEIISESLLFIRHDIESRSIILSATFDRDLASVLGDRIQLQQVVINLLVNSVQAIAQGSKSPRRIELRTSCDESGPVAFSIQMTMGLVSPTRISTTSSIASSQPRMRALVLA